jgi:hypothetical protein
MRQILILSCVVAFLVSYDEIYVLIAKAGPLLKLLLGAGFILYVWLLVLWEDFAQSKNEHGSGARRQ